MNATAETKRRVTLDAITHNGVRRIALRFPYDAELIAAAKTISAQWSRTHNCWHVENGSPSMKAVFAAFKGRAWVHTDALFAERAAPAVAPGPIKTAPERPTPKVPLASPSTRPPAPAPDRHSTRRSNG